MFRVAMGRSLRNTPMHKMHMCHFGSYIFKGNAPAPWGDFSHGLLYNANHLPVIQVDYQWTRDFMPPHNIRLVRFEYGRY